MKSPRINDLTKRILLFRNERHWKQFHTSKDLALSLALEAAEVLQIFQWKNGAELERHLEQSRDHLGAELSDVLYWVLLMAHETGVDLGAAFEAKMRQNEAKYPIAKARGSSRKYSEL